MNAITLLKRFPARIDYWLAFGLGSGLSPKAPGTAGTLMGVLLYFLLNQWGMWLFEWALLAAVLMGPWICQQAVTALGVDDHPAIVWDEIAGYGLAMLFIPPYWLWALVGFVLFRVIDIFKPWPISWVDRRVKGGLGVMLDDLCAGLVTNLALQLLLYLAAFD